MQKKFAVTLIVLTTIVYGTIFGMSLYYKTGFFDEILIQINRISTNLSHPEKIQMSKSILNTILNNDQPPGEWGTSIAHQNDKSPAQLFFFYKVWILETGLTQKDIANSYPVFQSQQKHITLINMRYGKAKPVLQFPFIQTKKDILLGLFFPINELPFSADYNKDGLVDYEDVLMAQKKATAPEEKP